MNESQQLIVVDELFGRVFPLPEGTTIIGRSEDCDITVSRGSIGQRHAALRWEDGVLSVEDLKSTNGTYVLPRDSAEEGGGVALTSGPTTIEIGDRLIMGLGRLVVQPASWLGDAPPAVLPARQTADGVWIESYLKWRCSGGLHSGFESGPIACSPELLIALRDALDDPVRWFLDRGLDVVKMLAKSDTRVGVLLALDVRLRHASRGFREVAGVAVRKVASLQGTSITELACARFIELADGTLDELQLRFAANVIESARKQGIAWAARDWRRLMSQPAFAHAARDFVFAIRGRDVMFRPADDELLTLDGTTTVRNGEKVDVAPALDHSWHEHLAEYEVAQPFPQ